MKPSVAVARQAQAAQRTADTSARVEEKIDALMVEIAELKNLLLSIIPERVAEPVDEIVMVVESPEEKKPAKKK